MLRSARSGRAPWRQAVDLANMMVILGLRTDAETCLRAGAAAVCTRGHRRGLCRHPKRHVAIAVAQLARPLKKEQGVDLVEEFRVLAPPSEPISIQRWSPRRLWLTIGAAALGLLFLMVVVAQIMGGGIL